MIQLDFAKGGGLLPAIAQDWKTGDVLMLAYINEEAWNETLKTGNATYWTRSRQKLWRKGEESGNVQKVKEIYAKNKKCLVVVRCRYRDFQSGTDRRSRLPRGISFLLLPEI